jgi:uncharacterized protein (DUF1697 family)
MPRYVAFLRAVNVGGRGVVTMDRLKRAFTALGYGEVRTIGHAGNIVFEARKAKEAALAKAIGAGLKRELGLDAEVAVRSLEALQALVAAAPFGKKPPGDDKRYVAFLCAAPKAKLKLPVVVEKEGLELFAVRGDDALLLSRRVKGRFGFPNGLVEKALGVAATTRNWNTVVKLGDSAP